MGLYATRASVKSLNISIFFHSLIRISAVWFANCLFLVVPCTLLSQKFALKPKLVDEMLYLYVICMDAYICFPALRS